MRIVGEPSKTISWDYSKYRISGGNLKKIAHDTVAYAKENVLYR
jgi:hypothetical protein